MFAVIKTGGKQYIVSEGEKVKIEKIKSNVGETITLEEVLLVSDKKGDVLLGTPFVKDAKVTAKVLEEGRGEKKIIFKHKPKKRYKLKKGHRQPYTEIEITKITLKEEKSKETKVAEKPKEEKTTEPKKTVKKSTPKKDSK